jgi:hypothetical protein
MIENPAPLITNDAVVLGILMTILGLIFITSEKPFSRNFDSPSVLLFHHPGTFNTFNIISGETSSLYNIASPLFITRKFSITRYQFRCIKTRKLDYVFGWNFGIIGGPLALQQQLS